MRRALTIQILKQFLVQVNALSFHAQLHYLAQFPVFVLIESVEEGVDAVGDGLSLARDDEDLHGQTQHLVHLDLPLPVLEKQDLSDN